MIEAEINTDLDDRYFWSNREIVCFTRIKTPETEKIPWLEEYYKKEEEMLKEEEIQLF